MLSLPLSSLDVAEELGSRRALRGEEWPLVVVGFRRMAGFKCGKCHIDKVITLIFGWPKCSSVVGDKIWRLWTCTIWILDSHQASMQDLCLLRRCHPSRQWLRPVTVGARSIGWCLDVMTPRLNPDYPRPPWHQRLHPSLCPVLLSSLTIWRLLQDRRSHELSDTGCCTVTLQLSPGAGRPAQGRHCVAFFDLLHMKIRDQTKKNILKWNRTETDTFRRV